jgi:hypothetical protein
MTRPLGSLVLSAAVLVSLAAAPALAQTSQPSAKATAKVGNVNVLSGPVTSGATQSAWQTILGNALKTSNQKDLFVNVSLEAGLYTSTLVKSKSGTADTSTATASVEVRVLVDGVETPPGPVVFARRTQELTAVFQGLLSGCLSVNPLTGAVVIDETCVQPEELSLLLETMNANSFGFVLPNVTVGLHTVEVQARIDLAAAYQQGSAQAMATIGKGSMTVEEVRMVRNEDVIQQ